MKIGVIKGNGIGPEITEAALYVLEATGLDFQWVPVLVADEAVEKYGQPLPQESVQLMKDLRWTLKAPLIVNKMKGRVRCLHADGSEGVYPSLNNAIRRELKLFVCPRPIKGVKNISGRYEHLDVAIMREITEDVYSGIEHRIGNVAAECTKLTTREAALRVARFGFDYARKYGRKRVTCVHKANAISITDGLFLSCFREVAAQNKDIESNDYMVDATAFYLAKAPELLDVIVTSNQYGDILSDLAAGLAGSLGLAPGANIGDGVAVFEASHGAAPDIAGKGVANPIALLLSGALMCRHLGKTREAAWIETSTYEMLAAGEALTADLGGKASTMDVARAIAARIKAKRS